MTKVSIIVPVYNTEKYLKKCLDSLCNQTLKDIEIICINDASTDKSLEILNTYAQKDQRVKLINFTENKGAAAARNAGINASSGEYIGFVDSDDFVDLDFYEKLYTKAIETNSEIAKANCKHLSLDGTEITTQTVLSQDKILFCSLYGSAIYKHSLIVDNHINFIENCNWGEDRLFPIKACYFSNKITIDNSTFYHYIRRSSSLTCSNYNYTKFLDGFNSTQQVLTFLNNANIKESEYNRLFNIFFKDLLSLFIKNFDTFKTNPSLQFTTLAHSYKYQNKFYTDFYQNIISYIEKNDLSNIKSEMNNFEKKLAKKQLFDLLKNNIKTAQTHIPIFLASDDNYAPFVATTIASICDNTKSYCEFYILDGGILEENKSKICKLKKKFSNFSIEFLNIDLDTHFNDLPETQYISKSMYSRFLIPELKPEIDKAIYSDVDVIFLGDIAEICKEDLEGYTLGAVWEEYAEGTINMERKRQLNLSLNHKYFSSGFLLIDCKKWRKDNSFKKLLEIFKTIDNELSCPDQDILNIYFNDNYKILSQKYCWINQNYNYYKTTPEIIIRHFNGQIKPWHISPTRKTTLIPEINSFWYYAKITDFYEEIYSKVLPQAEQDKILRQLHLSNLKHKLIGAANEH